MAICGFENQLKISQCQLKGFHQEANATEGIINTANNKIIMADNFNCFIFFGLIALFIIPPAKNRPGEKAAFLKFYLFSQMLGEMLPGLL